MSKREIELSGGARLDCLPLHPGLGEGAVLICPGGGYHMVAADREGYPVARAWRRAGFHAFVLHYAVEPAPLGHTPLTQAAEALAQVRALSGELAFPPDRVAVHGFSAGGHLAASLGVMWHREDIFGPGGTPEDRRPDALVLSYPVITAGEKGHQGSFIRLAGEDPQAWPQFSPDTQVDGRTPPTFLWHTVEDDSVPVENSLIFAQALRAHGVPMELHLYHRGPHGMSLATPDLVMPERVIPADRHVGTWFDLAAGWLAETFSE